MRRTAVLIGGAALVGAALTGVLLSTNGSSDDSAAPSDETALPRYDEDVPLARTLARQACDVLDDFLTQVRTDGPAEQAQRTLETFERTALRAYSHDVRWVPLLTSAKSLRESLRLDDAGTAQLALATADGQCTTARSTPPSGP